jgi:hypothetical protein
MKADEVLQLEHHTLTLLHGHLRTPHIRVKK